MSDTETDFVMIKLPRRVYDNLVKIAGFLWSEEDHDENYNDAVTCGNADDSYDEGETQGAADTAAFVLAYEVKE